MNPQTFDAKPVDPSPGIASGLAHYAKVPIKFDIPVERQEAFLDGCATVIAKVNRDGGLSNQKLPDAILIVALEASSGSLCPGFLGSRRPKLEERLKRLFGENSWQTQHLIAGAIAPQAAAFKLYESAYVAYFKKHPEKLDWLCKNYANVYDTTESNVQSGGDYTHQEAAKLGTHIHDIAIRRAVAILGRKFEGEALLQVRSAKSEGYCLSPGEIEFHKPELVTATEVPNPKIWWQPGSIEDFYQRTRRLVVTEFDDSNILAAHLTSNQERPDTACMRIASRGFLRLLPTLTSPEVGLSQLNDLPWMIDRNSFPLDVNSLPRPLSKEEILTTVKALDQQLEHFFRKNSSGNALMTDTPWVGFEHSHRFIEALTKWSKGEKLTLTERNIFPDFSEIASWENALPYFWDHTYGEAKRPLFLARDAWIVMEYLAYRTDLVGQDREHCKHSVYIPGTNLRPSLQKNLRSNCQPLEEIVLTLHQFAVEARELAEGDGNKQTIRQHYITLVKNWIETSEENPGSIWHKIFTEVADQFKDGLNKVVVVDTDGTGKTAQFLATLLEYFAQKDDPSTNISVLLGGMKGTADAPPLYVPNLAELYQFPTDSSSGRHIPDARWPFSFAGYNPDPRFNVEKHPCRYLVLLFRTLHIYNQAVRDFYPQEGIEQK